MMANHLSSGRLNVGMLREAARLELLRCIDKCSGSKAVVCDEFLTEQLSLIVEYVLLKDHGVLKIFQLKRGSLPHTNVKNIIFLTRAKLSLMEAVADNVHKAESQGPNRKEFFVFFVPRKSMLCEQMLKELGVYANFSAIEECSIELFPFDSDLISMEMDSVFRECHLEHDMTSMFHVAKALMKIQAIYGVIPSIYGKGKCAKHVYELMLRMRREMAGQEIQLTPQIDTLLLIDREVDLLSPLVTQLTYEGLIDEIYGIHHTNVKFPPEKFYQQQESATQGLPTEPKTVVLNSGEELYNEIRDKHFKAVGPILKKKAKTVSDQLDERCNATTVSELKQFVSKLPQVQTLRQSVSTHSTIGQLIKDYITSEHFLESQNIEQEFLNYIDTDRVSEYIERCIARQDNLIKVLRLICIQSITNSGLKNKMIEFYKREIMQTYGFQHMLTLQNLERTGLLRLAGSRTYTTLRKSLRLTVDEIDEQMPTDAGYVHSGYAPLSVRLAQFLSRPGWHSYQDVLAMLPGPTVEETQNIPVGLRKRRGSGSSTQSSAEDQKLTLVFFLGGCTFAEIAALRFLSQLEDAATDYVIATTQIINKNTFIKSLMEPLT